MRPALSVGVLGAGAIGGYLGVRLSASGVPVTLLGRTPVTGSEPLVAVDLAGTAVRADPTLVRTDDPASLAAVDVCLVTVKSQDTEAAAATLARVLRPGTIVVSFQNGLRNGAILRARLPNEVVPGMVTFNVRREGATTFRRTTSGPLLAGTHPRLAPLVDAFAKAGEPLGLEPDIEAILATKLLLNLNNGLCALTGFPVADSLRNRDLRRCYSICMREGIRVLRAAKRPTARIGPLAPGLVARLLLLPDALFLRVARSMLSIDPRARSSTLQDIDAGKPTEIDWLSGEIVRMASEQGLSAPANAWVTAAVHRLETSGLPPPFLTPREVRAGLEGAR
jgi:2-dehydropantoate 2-reductase